MPGRMRHLAVRSALLATLIAGGFTATASATDVPSDIIDWFVDTSYDAYSSTFTSRAAAPTPCRSAGSTRRASRRRSMPPTARPTSQLGGIRTYAVGSTSYQTLFTGATDTCFQLWGRTTSGSMSDHDGRVLR